MRSRSATAGLMVDASRVIQETVGVLSDTELGFVVIASDNSISRVDLLRMRAEILRSELVSVPHRLVSETKASVM